jgi:acyl transferase domain-containing protein
MGRVAMAEFPIFSEVIHSLDQVLAKLNPAPCFKLANILLDDAVDAGDRMNEAMVAQPMCTAVQIALVDLFSQWKIKPLVSIGHSSGEIGAAYAAGLISAPEAIVAAYCRGAAVHAHSGEGSMLAVGLGVDEVSPLLPADPTEVCIACQNSSQSVTLSGRSTTIAELRDSLSAKGIFARELETGRAYHSPHMSDVATAYETLLASSLELLSEDDRLWCNDRSEMVSSVTGKILTGGTLPEGYFSMNLRQTVRFDEAVQRMGSDESFSGVNVVLEVGPHSALAGPFKQICVAAKFDRFTYIPSMVRNKNDGDQLLSVAGSMFLNNYPLSLEEVNAAAYDEREKGAFRKPKTQYLLVDLPPYPWNYEKTYWVEPRASAEQRARAYPRHDLLGSRISGLSSNVRVWRNVLQARNVPWLRDHSLGGISIFPAAGYLSMAIEAVRQVHEKDEGEQAQPMRGITLRNVDIKTTLNIPDSEDEGIETLCTLQPAETPGWYSFTIESYSGNDQWTNHCDGLIRVDSGSSSIRSAWPARLPVDETGLGQRVSGKRWYDAFERVGFHYGPAFQQLQYARTDRGLQHAAGEVTVRESSGLIQGESRSLIHPSTVDACLQLIIVSIHSGKHKEMPWGVVPTRIEEVSMIIPDESDVSPATGHAVAWTDAQEGRRFNTHVQLTGKGGQTLLEIKSLTCTAYEAALPLGADNAGPLVPYSASIWKPDLSRLRPHQATRLFSEIDSKSALEKLIELIAHRQPVTSVLLLGSSTTEAVDTTLTLLPSSAKVNIGYLGEEVPILSESAEGRVVLSALSGKPDEWDPEFTKEPVDVLIIDDLLTDIDITKWLLPLLKDGGWLLGPNTESSSTFSSALTVGKHLALQKTVETPLVNGEVPRWPITLLSFSTECSQDLISALQATGCAITHKPIVDFASEFNGHVVIDDTDGQFFSSLNAESFGALKRLFAATVRIVWLTRGVQQGRSMVGGMAEGFLRVICSEQAASRIILLDCGDREKQDAVGHAVHELLLNADTKDSGCDREFWLNQGILHVSRVFSNKGLNRDLDDDAKLSNLESSLLPEGALRKIRMIDGEIALEHVMQETEMAQDEVEIQVLASQETLANTNGIMIAGVISKKGTALDTSLVGKRAVAFVPGDLRTYVRATVFATLDEGVAANGEALLRTLGPLSKVADLTLNKTKVQAGDRVLALPGPQTTMRILARLGKKFGWDLAVVVRSQDERTHYDLLADFKDVRLLAADEIETLISHLQVNQASENTSTVIAHDFTNLGHEVWRRIPACGRFLLSNSETAPLSPDMVPFMRGAAFITVKAKDTPSGYLLERCARLIETYPDILFQEGNTPSQQEAVLSGKQRDVTTPIISLLPGKTLTKVCAIPMVVLVVASFYSDL